MIFVVKGFVVNLLLKDIVFYTARRNRLVAVNARKDFGQNMN